MDHRLLTVREYAVFYNPTEAQVTQFIDTVGDALALDIETQDLEPYTSRILMVQIASEANKTVLVFTSSLPKRLLELLETSLVIAHNLKFDYKFMRRYFKISLNTLWDTMLAEACLNLGRNLRLSLADVAARRLNLALDKSVRQGFIGRRNKNFTDQEIIYAAEDTTILFDIYTQQLEEVSQANLQAVVDLENEAVLVTAEMELTGIGFNAEDWKQVLADTEQAVLKAARNLYNKSPYKKPVNVPLITTPRDETRAYIKAVNLASSKQNLEDLQELGYDVEQSDAFTLKELTTAEGDFPDLLLKFRKLEKLYGAFLTPILNMVNPVTHKIHPEYTQLSIRDIGKSGTVTGRYSCRRFQQIPKEKSMRNCFVADPGHMLLTMDWSNVELRIAANLSGERVLIDFFNGDFPDYHGYTASVVFGYPLEDVSNRLVDGVEISAKLAEVRAKAKTTNFSLLYLVSKYGLSKRLGVELDEAQEIIDKYHAAMPQLLATVQGYGDFAVKHRYISDQTLGRIRYFPTEMEDWKIMRAGANFPIQGTNANQMKLALTRFRKTPGLVVVGTVHDECILQVKAEEAAEKAQIARRIMIESANEILSGPVPYDCGVSIAPYWTK